MSRMLLFFYFTLSSSFSSSFFFFFNDTATTEIYTLSLHDALPISISGASSWPRASPRPAWRMSSTRSEEHTSELQSQFHLVCRLLLEKKKKKKKKKKQITKQQQQNKVHNTITHKLLNYTS